MPFRDEDSKFTVTLPLRKYINFVLQTFDKNNSSIFELWWMLVVERCMSKKNLGRMVANNTLSSIIGNFFFAQSHRSRWMATMRLQKHIVFPQIGLQQSYHIGWSHLCFSKHLLSFPWNPPSGVKWIWRLLEGDLAIELYIVAHCLLLALAILTKLEFWFGTRHTSINNCRDAQAFMS